MIQIVALSPRSLESPTRETGPAPLDPESLIPKAQRTLATGIPTGKVPEYTVEQFNYVSTHNGTKQWNLIADHAYLYNQEKVIHTRSVKALLYDPDGRITVVTGLEAKYFMDGRDLEIFGNVRTVLPDGFELRSEYLQYRPKEGTILIPQKYRVNGFGQDGSGGYMAFDSNGMDFDVAKGLIILPERVKMNLNRLETPADRTVIESDRCMIYRNTQVAQFFMNASRPLDKRFVYITQPDLFARGRQATLNYGDFSTVLRYLYIENDVLIKETRKPTNTEKASFLAEKPDTKGNPAVLRYSTSGRADFDSQHNQFVLTNFPQVYQDADTVTGEVIIVHRDTDTVEIEHSNSFSEGSRKQ